MKLTWKKILSFFGVIAILAASNFFAYSEMKSSFKERESYILEQNSVLRSKVSELRSENSKMKKSINEYEETRTNADGSTTQVRKKQTRVEIEKEIRQEVKKELESNFEKKLQAERETIKKQSKTKKTTTITGGVYINPDLSLGYQAHTSVEILGPLSGGVGIHSDGRATIGIGINF